MVIEAQHHFAHLRCPDVRGNVDADALLFEPRKVLPEAAPVGVDVQVTELRLARLDDGVVQRRDRFALARDLRGDALVDLRGQARIDEYRELRLAEHVDETRRDHHPLGIDGARARLAGEQADGGHPAIADANVPRVPGRAGAIDDVPIGDDEIEGLRVLRARGSGQGQQRSPDNDQGRECSA